MYQISNGHDLHEADTRREAIDLARDLSAQSYQEVVILGERGRERLTYRGGELEAYTYETRHRGRR